MSGSRGGSHHRALRKNAQTWIKHPKLMFTNHGEQRAHEFEKCRFLGFYVDFHKFRRFRVTLMPLHKENP